MNDFKFAFRQLLKNPGFTAVAVLTLALGIGANTAMFSFVNAILLRPLPYQEPDRLVMVFENHVTNEWFKLGIDAPMLEEWRRQNTVFQALGAVRSYGDFTLTGKGQAAAIKGSALSANIFSILGIQPLLGRDFLAEEETHGKHRVVLLSHELWQRRFGGDSSIIGQSLTLGRELHTVVGVMPPGTVSPDGVRELWTALAFTPEELLQTDSHNYSVYARLKPGVTLEQARGEMNAVARRRAAADPRKRGWGAEVHPLHEIIVGNSRRLLLVLLGSVGLVLVIGCANIASLLLARSASRAREFAIRSALGAGRAALIRQLLTESCVLAAIGGVLGIFLARFGLNALVRFSPPDLPRMIEGIPLDGATLAFTVLITLATGIMFGLMPALHASNPALSSALAETARGGSAGPRRQLTRAALVVGEVALSLVLLIGAVLTIRSFGKLLTQNLGFVPEHLVTMLVSLPDQSYPGQAERSRLFDALLTAVRTIHGVDSAGYAFGAPLTQINSRVGVVNREAPPPAPGESVRAGYAQVSPGYFAVLKTPLVQGRDFTESDTTNTTPVVIVDETFARNLNLGDRVIGRHIDVGDGTQNAEIVGVVKDIKRTGMADALRGEMYRPYRQTCWGVLTLVVRTPRDPVELTRAIRSELDRLDKDLPLQNLRTMTQLVAANIAQRRLSAQLLGGFAASALLLSALGLYGVLSGFTAVAVLTLALGIGANTALFSIINAVLLRPLPYPESERLVWVGETRADLPFSSGHPGAVSYQNFVDWRAQQTVFESIGAYQPAGGSPGAFLIGDEPVRMEIQRMSADAFAALKVTPAMGRVFYNDEDRPGGAPSVVLSHRTWQEHFGGSPAVVGQTVTMNGVVHNILGVMPPGFSFPYQSVEAWLPLGALPVPRRVAHDFGTIARLKPGVTLEQARAEMATLAAGLEQAYPEDNQGWKARVEPLVNVVIRDVGRPLWTLFGAVGMVLLIACANVANLLLARASARRQEMGVRVALGASRGRIVRQLLGESLLLSFIGTGLGLLLAKGGLDVFIALAGNAIPRATEIRLDGSVLRFAAALAGLTGIVFGLAPAWTGSGTAVHETLKAAGGRGGTGERGRMRQGLIVAEVALTLLLLTGAGLLRRSFQRLQSVNQGFSGERVLSFDVALPGVKYRTAQVQDQFFERLIEKLRVLQGVEEVGLTSRLPLKKKGGNVFSYSVEGQAKPPGRLLDLMERIVASPSIR